MKNTTFANKDNAAAAIGIAAIFAAIVGTVFNGATARADQPMEEIKLDPIIVTASREHVVKLDTIVIIASRNVNAG
jgi:hypothetical protein